MMKKIRNRKKLLWGIGIAVLAAAILIGACIVYLGTGYDADMDAVAAFGGAVESRQEQGTLVFEPEAPVAGFIFYPGGKVDHAAYIPLMQACARQGILCVLTEMPFDLAVLDINAADGIRERYPQVDRWYIGGHSLGGAMAAAYLGDHADEFEGLVLLGAYSTQDLSHTQLGILSVYGSEDQVMDREKYEQCRENLPTDFTELVIDGGCHAYFGTYGPQTGDGAPTITNEAQILRTAEAITDLVIPNP